MFHMQVFHRVTTLVVDTGPWHRCNEVSKTDGKTQWQSNSFWSYSYNQGTFSVSCGTYRILYPSQLLLIISRWLAVVLKME